MGQNDSKTNNISGNKINCDTIECFASTAELLRPKKKSKIEDLSTITIGYIKDKHPDRKDENRRFRVLFDSGCSATLINKRFVKHWKKNSLKPIKWSTTKLVVLRLREDVTLNLHFQPSMNIARYHAWLMLMNPTMNHVTMI